MEVCSGTVQREIEKMDVDIKQETIEENAPQVSKNKIEDLE